MQEYKGTFVYIFMYIALQVCTDLDISVNNKTSLMTTEKKETKKKVSKIFFLPHQLNPVPTKRVRGDGWRTLFR